MAELERHACPSCAAPLAIPEDHQRYFLCSFCGMVVEDHNAGFGGDVELSLPDPETVDRGGLVSYTSEFQRKSTRISLVYLLVILVVIAAIVAIMTAVGG